MKSLSLIASPNFAPGDGNALEACLRYKRQHEEKNKDKGVTTAYRLKHVMVHLCWFYGHPSFIQISKANTCLGPISWLCTTVMRARLSCLRTSVAINEAKGCLKAAAIQLVLGSKLAFHGLSLC